MIRALLYIAASYSKDRLRAKAFIERCKAAGFGISHDWTDEMPAPPGTSEADRRALSRRQAEDDIRGARDAEVLVLLASDAMRGAWIEVGATLSHNGYVLVVGEVKDAEHFVFLALPHVYRVANEDEAMHWLEANA